MFHLQLFLDGRDSTADFDVIGVMTNHISGTTRGLQRVRTVYELIDRVWTADPLYDQKMFKVQNGDTTFIETKFNVGEY